VKVAATQLHTLVEDVELLQLQNGRDDAVFEVAPGKKSQEYDTYSYMLVAYC
jgi:hypothetical protein